MPLVGARDLSLRADPGDPIGAGKQARASPGRTVGRTGDPDGSTRSIPSNFRICDLPDDGTIGNSDMMPLWALGELSATNTRKFSFHWDGLQTDLYETVISGAIGDGMSYKSFPRTKDTLDRMMEFARLQVPPPSPFSTARRGGDPYHVDAAAVERGRAIYAAQCATCHEPSGPRYRMPIPAVEVGTDRHRLDMWTEAARERYTDLRAAVCLGLHELPESRWLCGDEPSRPVAARALSAQRQCPDAACVARPAIGTAAFLLPRVPT